MASSPSGNCLTLLKKIFSDSELEKKAGRSGHSAEAEHRLILASVLLMPKRKTFTEVIADMPNIGEDSDFERLQESDDVNVFN